jgi:hypothetical protein
LKTLFRKDSRNFLERCAQDLQRRKMQTFKNERIKKVKYFEEINNIQEMNKAKGLIIFKNLPKCSGSGKLTKNESSQLVKKLMFDAERRQRDKETALANKSLNELIFVRFYEIIEICLFSRLNKWRIKNT